MPGRYRCHPSVQHMRAVDSRAAHTAPTIALHKARCHPQCDGQGRDFLLRRGCRTCSTANRTSSSSSSSASSGSPGTDVVAFSRARVGRLRRKLPIERQGPLMPLGLGQCQESLAEGRDQEDPPPGALQRADQLRVRPAHCTRSRYTDASGRLACEPRASHRWARKVNSEGSPAYSDLILPIVRAVSELGGSAAAREITTQVLVDLATLAQPMRVRAPHTAGPTVSVLVSVVPGRPRLHLSKPLSVLLDALTSAPSDPRATTCQAGAD